ncbi:hypothetical protein P4H27_26205 [Paenibacillus taichungensis]|uniref:hypothetical protein n=1 Tax=Paenibacillus taichungensis TaxID=484184 RepID=UPI002DBF5FAF|nr:hypothetical protein [Paenibacillus taichungensis]MEC0110468.1 hypothetical protein [Paenibacillus taichungensis]MEC0197816.1 hypothetical protein [Paenibacillus taichungensis]
MILDKSTDTSGLTQVAALSDELQPVFDKAESKYQACGIELFFVFRCLPEEYERKSTVRYAKKDNTIYFDMTVSEDQYKTFSKSRQRYELSHYFYAFLSDKLKKYKIEHLIHTEFMNDMEEWLKDIGWLQSEFEASMNEYGE